MSEYQPERSTREGEKDGFGENLAKDANGGCAERGANRNLLLTAEGFRERQVGHVDASYEKNESHCSQKNQQRGLHVRDHIFVQGQHDRSPPFVVVRIKLLQSARDRIHFRLCLLEFNTWLEARDDEIMMLSPYHAFLIRPGHRSPHFRKIGQAETRRHHSSYEVFAPNRSFHTR